jgi:hypothetical protein
LVAKSAAQHGKLPLLKYLVDECALVLTPEIVECASQAHQYALVKWAFSKGVRVPLTSIVTRHIAWRSDSNLSLLKWAVDNGAPFDTLVIKNACSTKKFNMVIWAINNGCPFIHSANDLALTANLDVIKLAHEQGCPFNSLVTFYAAAENNGDLLKWAYENGIPFHERTYTELVMHKDDAKETLEWAVAHGCKVSPNLGEYAIMTNDFELLRFAFTNGCKINIHNILHLIHHGSVNILRWLYHSQYKNKTINGYFLDLMKAYLNKSRDSMFWRYSPSDLTLKWFGSMMMERSFVDWYYNKALEYEQTRQSLKAYRLYCILAQLYHEESMRKMERMDTFVLQFVLDGHWRDSDSGSQPQKKQRK